MTQAQMIDDYRVLWISGTHDHRASLALLDTSVPQPWQLVFEMPSNKLNVVYDPIGFVGSASIQGAWDYTANQF